MDLNGICVSIFFWIWRYDHLNYNMAVGQQKVMQRTVTPVKLAFVVHLSRKLGYRRSVPHGPNQPACEIQCIDEGLHTG